MQDLPLIVTYIIDDDKLHQFGMRRMFKYIHTPVQLFQFYNGLQALEYIKAHLPQLINLPDVILLDVNMPVMNGWQFLDEFIQLMPPQNHRTTIYMVTSSISDADVEKAASYSEITEYIIKPADIEQVKELFEDIHEKLS
ncbi:response regulator [Ilyomonas limi]|uniref:Response regulator n=1 Tax=Ilyomonas limi TaxID=2575867 RepID=A0A4U3KTJ7_9BACT|nr:response regulator [Ilyomonas limi]TKK65670.1 response regulator [Ilyomonas limi]